MKLLSINPYTEEVNGEFDRFDRQRCSEAAAKARGAFENWSRAAIAERLAYIDRMASVLRRNKDEYAALITREMGKPVKQAAGEIEKCAMACDYYVENAERFLRREDIQTETSRSFVDFEPLGVILGIMPWNFPFWQVLRFGIPALAAGNVCLLKHASNVPMCALRIERAFTEAGFPEGVFQTLLIGADGVRQLIEADEVDGVSLTGSTQAGASVGSLAGKHIKKLVLELGGSDPFIVLADADVEQAAEAGLWARNQNAGQSCIAAKRFIVAEPVARAFEEAFVQGLKKLRIGDPMKQETDIGPVARKEFLPALQDQLDDAMDKGARVAYGPEPPAGKGFFFKPAVLTGVDERMKVMSEEVFGPIAPIIVARDEDEALRLANATDLGLGASIWSRDVERAIELSRQIRSGFVAINDIVKSDPRLPFGGVKKSGVGRELSHYGLKEFVNIKTVVVK